MRRIFGINCACDPTEFFTMLSPQRVDTVLLKIRAREAGRHLGNVYSTTRGHENVHVIFTLPKLSGPKFGNPALLSWLDHSIHFLYIFAMLPWLLIFYNTFIFICPPFFDTVTASIMRLFKMKVVIVVTDAWVEQAKSSLEMAGKKMTSLTRFKLGVGRVFEIFAAKSADEIFVVSKFLFDLNRGWSDKVFFIPNGADVGNIEQLPQKRMFDRPTIVYLGGFEQWRGVDLLVDAYKLVRDKTRAKLLLIGGGPDLERVKKYAGDYPDIKFTGYLKHDEAISYVKGADVAVMPARDCLAARTVSSIKCFEYIACETPAIVTDSGEHAYWTKKYSTGIVVKDTPEDIADGISKLLNNKNLYEATKENCRNHKWDVDFKRTRKIYVKKLQEQAS